MNQKLRKLKALKRAACVALLLGISPLAVSPRAFAQQASGTVQVDVPHTISYQGMISNANGPIKDGNHTITITFYADKSATTPLWNASYTTTVSNGVFNLLLGADGTPALPQPMDMNRPIWVGVSVDGEKEMQPLSQLSASPYALNVPDNSISASKISADYVGSILVNGTKVTGNGSSLNLSAGPGMDLSYDPTTSTVFLASSGTTTNGKGKGANPLWVGYQPGTNIDGTGNTTADLTNSIGGGDHNTANPYGTTGTVTGGYASILGGLHNTAGFNSSSTSGNKYASVGGGQYNTADGTGSTVGGGENNTAGQTSTTTGADATVSGGLYNTAKGASSAIAGGAYLTVGDSSFGFNNAQAGSSTTDLTGASGFFNSKPVVYFGNVDLVLGNYNATAADRRPGTLYFFDQNGDASYAGTRGHYAAFKASGLTADATYTLPPAYPTTTGYVLSSTTGGALSWVANGTGGGVTGTGTATQVAFWNSSSSIAGNSLLYWDNTNHYLGIGVAAPAHALDVAGDGNISGNLGVGNNLTVTGGVTVSSFGTGIVHSNATGVLSSYPVNLASADVSGILGTTNGGTGTSTTFTPGSIIFAGSGGIYTQNNSNIFWDNTNSRLGIGTNTPNTALEVNGDVRIDNGASSTTLTTFPGATSLQYYLPKLAPAAVNYVLTATNITSPIKLAWQSPAAIAGAWSTSGNTLTGGEKLGSTNAQDVHMFANNTDQFDVVQASGSSPGGAAAVTQLGDPPNAPSRWGQINADNVDLSWGDIPGMIMPAGGPFGPFNIAPAGLTGYNIALVQWFAPNICIVTVSFPAGITSFAGSPVTTWAPLAVGEASVTANVIEDQNFEQAAAASTSPPSAAGVIGYVPGFATVSMGGQAGIAPPPVGCNPAIPPPVVLAPNQFEVRTYQMGAPCGGGAATMVPTPLPFSFHVVGRHP